MAKKNQGGDVFTLIIFAAVAIVAALFFLLKLAITLATYAFPMVAIGAFFALRQSSATPPAIPDATGFDRPDIAAEIGQLIRHRLGQERLVAECYAAGDADGIMLTKASDNTRFAERSHRGKKLNAEIDEAERKIEALQHAIDHKKGTIRDSFPFWMGDQIEWARQRAASLSLHTSLMVAGGVMVLCYLLAAFSREPVFWHLQAGLLYAPSFLISPIACGALCGYASFYLVWKSKTAELLQQVDANRSHAWDALYDRWGSYSGDEPFVRLSDTRSGNSGAKPNGTRPSGTASRPPWCSVLNVEPDASPDEIRKAYYAARKKYNPDLAASMGEDIQNLANEKSKEINLAYEAARAAKGF